VALGGKKVGIEWDQVLFEETRLNIEGSEFGKSFIPVNDNYTNLEAIARENGIKPDGILFDLGLSSWHYETSGRGFSFKKVDEPLDMRFNSHWGQPASALINTAPVAELKRIFQEYGEEQFARSIAETIKEVRRQKLILKVGDLVEIIEASVPHWYQHRKIHCATKTFQALRVAVNDELANITAGVEAAIQTLTPGGRLAVISFQGLEDKIVRELFKKNAREKIISWVKRDTIRPAWAEMKDNPRARSAKMKVIQKL
jgi:16S rRNA (cytosine1402-N4)-methyltransferase